MFRREGAPDLCYHNFIHTEGVVADALWIGKGSCLNEEQLFIVELAAWFHDSGFTNTYKTHEKESAELASSFLRHLNVESYIIEQVTESILATRMPQSPQNLIQEVLCDADLAYLGSNRFFDVSERLRTEWKNENIENLTEHDFSMVSADFLRSHRYFTEFARQQLDEGKWRNLNLIGVKVQNNKHINS